MGTLALNMIVGKGEAALLDRALQSVKCIPFDEIIICLTSQDQEVANVASRYANKIAYYEWNDDFSTARNACLDGTESDYVFWMDADDVLSYDSQKVASEFAYQIKNSDIPIYTIGYDLGGGKRIKRASIFRRDVGEWKYPVHENIELNQKVVIGHIDNFLIEHKPTDGKCSCERNIRIMEKYLVESPDDARMNLYLAKEYFIDGQKEKAIEKFIQLVECRELSSDERAYCCKILAYNYAYDVSGDVQKINRIGIDRARMYANIGLSFNQTYSELLVLIGDLYEYEGMYSDAEYWHKKAIDIPVNIMVEYDTRYSGFIPADRLSNLYYKQNDYINALYYNDKAYSFVNDERVLKNKRIILDAMIEDVNIQHQEVTG